jgi:putative transcriptional regulator
MNKRDIGQELLDSLRAIKQGKGKTYTVIEPFKAKAIREQMNLDQPTFAQLLRVSTKTVQAWETGQRQPSGIAQALLSVLAHRPDVVLEVLKPTDQNSR